VHLPRFPEPVSPPGGAELAKLAQLTTAFMAPAQQVPGTDDQARLLEDALAVVRQQTVLMRRCLETPGKLMDALKCW